MHSGFIGVYGCSGFGREVMPFLASQIQTASEELSPRLCFIDDSSTADHVNSYPLFNFNQFCDLKGQKQVVLAIANTTVRRALFDKLNEFHLKVLDIRAQNVVTYDDVQLGAGSIICSGCILTSNISIGHCFHCNINSYVAHDSSINNFMLLPHQMQWKCYYRG